MIQAIIKEISLRKDFLKTKELTSIYLGGGTPSLLDASEINRIFESLSQYYSWEDDVEITIEANPDDLSRKQLKSYYQDTQINRLSIGIQSFTEADLKYMNRAHNALEAKACINIAQDIGFSNISADLIYGSPTTSDADWDSNITTMLEYEIPHISAYALTVEEGTALHHFVKTGKSKPINEDKAARQFETLVARLSDDGYDHYEISNFGKPGKYAIHNSNYWMGISYLGLGPAAHSFDGKDRRSWNIAHNAQYIKAINQNEPPNTLETLSQTELYNEYILIRLRTIWGISKSDIQSKFPNSLHHLESQISPYLASAHVLETQDGWVLTKEGKLIADKISMELFLD